MEILRHVKVPCHVDVDGKPARTDSQQQKYKRRWADHVVATIVESDPVALSNLKQVISDPDARDLVAQQAFKRFLRVLRTPEGKEIVRSMKYEFFLKEAEFHPKPEGGK